MLALPLLTESNAAPHPDLRLFASEERPLRPSKSAKFGGCPMGVLLSMWVESLGNKAAQTGNLVHDACEFFHKAKEGDRVAAGLAALERAREQFPDGDAEKARTIFRAYSADPENEGADVVWCEEPVTLRLAPAPEDPTGLPVVIKGTLDQVRRDRKDRKLRVWDIKTGERLDSRETADEYAIQQAVYTLAARQTLDPEIETGGLIYTPAYAKARGKPFISLRQTVDECIVLVSPLVHWVAAIRKGIPLFKPSADNCRFCDLKPWPTCRQTFLGIYGR